jgi:hypothetical protein
MVVNRSKLGYTMFHRPQSTISGEYLKSEPGKSVVLMGHTSYVAEIARYLYNYSKATSLTVFGLTYKFDSVAGGHKRMPLIIHERSVKNRLERLEKQFNNLVKSTWSYLFSKGDIEEMGELSKGMLESTKKMRELAEQLQEADDKC